MEHEVEARRRLSSAGIARRVAAGAIACAIAFGMLPAPAQSQSLTDRFKSLFGGGKSDEPAENAQQPAAPGGAESDDDCPPVKIRAGASTYAVAAPGKQPVGNDVRFQASITRTARECIKAGGDINAHVGIQGRVIAGPAGAPALVEIPLRVAVVQGGISEKVIATKAYRTTVAMSEEGSVPFSFVAEDMVYPVPPGAAADTYLFYIGFDPQALTPEPKARSLKKKK